MSSIQKIIKYFALAFALILIVSIISTIMAICMQLASIFNSDPSGNLDSNIINGEANVLEIDVNYSNLTIKQGENLNIETNNKYIKYEQNNKKLVIKEEAKWFTNKDKDLIITIPEDYTFDYILINNGAGQIQIDSLTTKNLEFELGAGKVNISHLNVLNEAKIESGAGEVIIDDAQVNNLDLDMGIGKVKMNIALTGINKIDAGIGSLELNLIGENYKIKVDKGIGSIKINGEEVKNTYYGTGSNLLDVSGGIGDIKINLNK